MILLGYSIIESKIFKPTMLNIKREAPTNYYL